MLALFPEMLAWWYGKGWSYATSGLLGKVSGIQRMFSVSTLLKTLFEPWKRITTTPGAGLEAKWQAFVDNMVSRLVGFSVRILVLITAGATIAGLYLLAAVGSVLWPLVPLLIPALIIKGLMG